MNHRTAIDILYRELEAIERLIPNTRDEYRQRLEWDIKQSIELLEFKGLDK